MNNQNNQDDSGKTNKKEKSVVALKYDSSRKTPKVIAKGKGYVADRILEEAVINDVYIHTDEDLAENLNKLELGTDIPPELFEIVAQIYIFADKIDSVMGGDIESLENNLEKFAKNV